MGDIEINDNLSQLALEFCRKFKFNTNSVNKRIKNNCISSNFQVNIEVSFYTKT